MTYGFIPKQTACCVCNTSANLLISSSLLPMYFLPNGGEHTPLNYYGYDVVYLVYENTSCLNGEQQNAKVNCGWLDVKINIMYKRWILLLTSDFH